MPSPSEYQPVPSQDDLHAELSVSQDDLHASASYPPRLTSGKASGTAHYSKKKILFFVLAFCVVAFGSYKLGQWSFFKSGLKDAQTQTEPTDLAETPSDSGTDIEPVTDETDMATSSGKLSVG